MVGKNLACNICLSEEVKGEVDRLILCNKCMKKVSKYWDKNEVKKY